MIIYIKTIVVALVCMTSLSLQSQENNWKYKITPFSNLGRNTLSSFTGYNALLHFGGVAATYGIIKSGMDYKIHNYFSQNREFYYTASTPAVYIGYTVPVCLGVGLYATGLINDNSKTAAAGCAVLQASLIAFSENCVLKAFTGRPNPDSYEYSVSTDRSDVFRFGFMRGGIHYGWPSGHMAVTTAVVSSLSSFYFDNKLLQAISWASWTYMFFGVLSHDGNTMHWTSDIVAGSMMGYAIGNTVGKNFREIYNGQIGNTKELTINVQPKFSTSYAGILLNCNF
jgi:hypothetical protein